MDISNNVITSVVKNDTKTKEIIKNDTFEINEVVINDNSSYTDISEFIQILYLIGNSLLITNLTVSANISNPNMSKKENFFTKNFKLK